MRNSSTSGFDFPGFDLRGFDLRGAVDGLRDAFDSRFSAGSSTEQGPRDIRSAILIELTVEPMHGYQLITAIGKRSGGQWTPAAGTVYPTLQLLADEGLVTSAQVGERKVYSLTDAGAAVAATLTSESSEPHSAHDRDHDARGAVRLTKSGAKLAHALTAVAHTGTPEQSERAAALIDEARRKLYAILAED